MSTALAAALFAVALGVTLFAAATFARRLDLLGAKFGLPEVLIGLLTAAAADGPELASALAALLKGARAASVGVIVGSNAFNLAAMIGISALVVGSVGIPLGALVLEGGIALSVAATVTALLLGWIPAILAFALVAGLLVPYLAIVVAGQRVAASLRLPRLLGRAIERASDQGHGSRRRAGVHFATHRQLALMVLDLGLIVGGSIGMVQAALSLGDRWGIRPALIGVLVLGPLTSLPNALTGIRLGLARRGAALVTEAFNSNTINLVAGVGVPSLVVSLAPGSTSARIDLAILAAMTVLAVGLLASPTGLRRRGGGALIALYAAFVLIQLS